MNLNVFLLMALVTNLFSGSTIFNNFYNLPVTLFPPSPAVIVRNLEDLIRSDRDISWGNGQSRRFLVKSDGMGFTLTDTIVNKNSESFLQYKNHLESCYCLEGNGEIETTDGVIYKITPGTMYALERHEKHYLRAKKTMRLVCVFLPALKGNESHKLTEKEVSTY